MFPFKFFLNRDSGLFAPNSEFLAVISIASNCAEGAYRWYSKKHDDQLFLVQDRVSNKCIRKSGEAPSALLNESSISCEMIAIDYGTLAPYGRRIKAGKNTSNPLGW